MAVACRLLTFEQPGKPTSTSHIDALAVQNFDVSYACSDHGSWRITRVFEIMARSPHELIAKITRQIEQHPSDLSLYLERAQMHLKYSGGEGDGRILCWEV